MVLSARADEPAKPEPAPLREFRGETEKESSGPFNARPIFTVPDYEAAWKELGLSQSPGEVDFRAGINFLHLLEPNVFFVGNHEHRLYEM